MIFYWYYNKFNSRGRGLNYDVTIAMKMEGQAGAPGENIAQKKIISSKDYEVIKASFGVLLVQLESENQEFLYEIG